MATTRQPREKISTTTSSSTPTVRRAPRASRTSSPDGEIHKLPEKPTPNYLKPTVKTSAARPAATSTARVPARKPVEKPPSQSSHRPPSREKSVPRTSPTPSSRSSVSPRPSLDKSSRATGKLPTSAPTTTKQKTRPTAAITTTAPDNYASDASSCKSETEEKLELPILEHETIVVDDHVELVDVPPLNDHILDELTEYSVIKDPEVVSVDSTTEVIKDEEITDAVSEHVDEQIEAEEKPMVVEAEKDKVETGNVAAEEKAEMVEKPAVDVRARQVEKKEGPKSNEVIEEFKSKMMVKKKNKVLALVGAFETVMSMQEPVVLPSTQPAKTTVAPPEDGGSSTKEARPTKTTVTPPEDSGSSTKEAQPAKMTVAPPEDGDSSIKEAQPAKTTVAPSEDGGSNTKEVQPANSTVAPPEDGGSNTKEAQPANSTVAPPEDSEDSGSSTKEDSGSSTKEAQPANSTVAPPEDSGSSTKEATESN